MNNGISGRGLGSLDLTRFRKVVIEGHGTYILTTDLAEAAAKMCQAAQEMNEAIHGIHVPVHLVGCGRQVISCIKFVRQVTGKNLKDAKGVVDKVRDGQAILLGRYPWNEAQSIKVDGEEHDAIIKIPSPLELLGEQAE